MIMLIILVSSPSRAKKGKCSVPPDTIQQGRVPFQLIALTWPLLPRTSSSNSIEPRLLKGQKEVLFFFFLKIFLDAFLKINMMQILFSHSFF